MIRNKTASPLISIEDFIKEMGMTAGRKNRKESDTDRLTRLYKGSLTDDRITVMSRILLAIRKERGITIDDIAVRLGMEYHKVAQLTGMLETDGVITTDLLQRCFINFR